MHQQMTLFYISPQLEAFEMANYGTLCTSPGNEGNEKVDLDDWTDW